MKEAFNGITISSGVRPSMLTGGWLNTLSSNRNPLASPCWGFIVTLRGGYGDFANVKQQKTEEALPRSGEGTEFDTNMITTNRGRGDYSLVQGMGFSL